MTHAFITLLKFLLLIGEFERPTVALLTTGVMRRLRKRRCYWIAFILFLSVSMYNTSVRNTSGITWKIQSLYYSLIHPFTCQEEYNRFSLQEDNE